MEALRVTHLFDPGSAGGKLPLGDGWFPHTNFRGEGEHSGGRSLWARRKNILGEVSNHEEKTRACHQGDALQLLDLPWTEVETLWKRGRTQKEVRVGRAEVE